MAYFKPRRNEQGLTEKRRLPSKPEGSSIGYVSLYDAFVGSLWKKTMDEYNRRGVGYNLAGETTIHLSSFIVKMVLGYGNMEKRPYRPLYDL